MSNGIIEDGTGKGYKVKVNEYNKFEVDSITHSEISWRSEENGQSYIVATDGFISLTSGESAILYIKYTGEKHLHIANLRTCGTGVQKWRMYKNSTNGTIISGASAATVVNMNFTSSNILSLVAYKGADGNTQTGGSSTDNWINNGGHSLEDFDGSVILGKNDSLVITCEASSAIDVCARFLVYESEED